MRTSRNLRVIDGSTSLLNKFHCCIIEATKCQAQTLTDKCKRLYVASWNTHGYVNIHVGQDVGVNVTQRR
jgi:hypothetical protein